MEKCRYLLVRNKGADDGLWVINKKRQAIYAKKELPPEKRLVAAEERARRA
jgi:hypothetical protein